MARGTQGVQVHDVVADAHARTRGTAGRGEDAERKVGEREVRAGGHVDPRSGVNHAAKVVNAGRFMRCVARRVNWAENAELAP